MGKKAAVFCHNGLGDAVISLVVSNNLHQNGFLVDTYHNGFDVMQSFFPHLPFYHYPHPQKVDEIFENYEKLIVFYNDSNDFVLKLIEYGKKEDPNRLRVIYPYPTQGIKHKKYYSDSLIDPSKPLVHSLKSFCKEILHLPKITQSNGIIVPFHLEFRKHLKRVVFHINSSRAGKNWPIFKYVKLALHLKEEGFEPAFIAGSEKDRKEYEWLVDQGFYLPIFKSLPELTEFIYESGYLIGNDSGLGHLASCMGIPTVTISRRKAVARFWRPGWAPGKIVVPHFLVPNIRGFRLRDRRWQLFISVKKVLRNFKALVVLNKNS